jgi:hypothetical protein
VQLFSSSSISLAFLEFLFLISETRRGVSIRFSLFRSQAASCRSMNMNSLTANCGLRSHSRFNPFVRRQRKADVAKGAVSWYIYVAAARVGRFDNLSMRVPSWMPPFIYMVNTSKTYTWQHEARFAHSQFVKLSLPKQPLLPQREVCCLLSSKTNGRNRS